MAAWLVQAHVRTVQGRDVPVPVRGAVTMTPTMAGLQMKDKKTSGDRVVWGRWSSLAAVVAADWQPSELDAKRLTPARVQWRRLAPSARLLHNQQVRTLATGHSIRAILITNTRPAHAEPKRVRTEFASVHAPATLA